MELSPAMQGRMTCYADVNEILLGVVAGVAAELFVMDFQVRHSAAQLTPPTVAAQHLLPQTVVRNRIQAHPRELRAQRAHETFSLRPSRNACRCSWGRNLKNLAIENSIVSGSPWSKLAPARKSAQIISKQ